LILADSLPHDNLVAQLQGRRDMVAEQKATLLETAHTLHRDPNPERRLALDYGMAIAAAELDWLDHVLTRFSLPSDGNAADE